MSGVRRHTIARKKWTLTAKRRQSKALKAAWALRKMRQRGLVKHFTADKPPKPTISQGARDFDAIMGRFSRMDRAGQQFTIAQCIATYAKIHGAAQ